MIGKLSTVISTVLYLRPVQIRYQLWYKLKNKFLTIDWYSKYSKAAIHPVKASHTASLIVSKNKCIDEKTFCFLNLTYRFPANVDWNYTGNGKLWNYNLQYFDYLLDESIPVSVRVGLLKDFSGAIAGRAVKPEAYPVSLRIINTLLFMSRHHVRDEIIDTALAYQIDYLENNLEYHILANHLLEDIFALYIAAIGLRNRALFTKIEKMLHEQLNEQVLADGAHFECTPMYHSIILSKLLLCIEIAENDSHFKANTKNLRAFASKMLGWLNEYSFKDGSWALMNDAALGIAPGTPSLNTAASALNIPQMPVTLKESGYRKLTGNDWESIIDVGNIIPSYQPGHAHADVFNFSVWYKGVQFITDTGISTYNNSSCRLKERSTISHNTVNIGGYNQSEVWSAFRVGRRAKVCIIKENNSFVRASHDGYKRHGVIHKRTFEVVNNSFVILDELEETRKPALKGEALIHLAPGIHCDVLDNRVMIKDMASILFFNAENISLDAYDFNEQYNQKRTATLIRVKFFHRLVTSIDFR